MRQGLNLLQMRTWADATTRKLKGGAAFHPSLVVFAQKVLIVALHGPNFVNVWLRSLSSPPGVGSQPDSSEWESTGRCWSWEAQLCQQGQVGQSLLGLSFWQPCHWTWLIAHCGNGITEQQQLWLGNVATLWNYVSWWEVKINRELFMSNARNKSWGLEQCWDWKGNWECSEVNHFCVVNIWQKPCFL